jgi:hypothetical protein
MRKLALAFAIGAICATTGFTVLARPAAAATPQAKVVIVVGPTGSATSGYKSEANAVAAVASQYTSNVVKVYSPSATWSAVQSAAAGANILVYIGHGNGQPGRHHPGLIPSSSDMMSVDGMGLNASASGSNYNVQYYGEAYVQTLGLAPHAVVLLSHLCFAAGVAAEDMTYHDKPTYDEVRYRVSNFAAGFIRAGAEAVLAENYNDAMVYYMTALFTRHTTIDEMWNTAPSYNGHVSSWESMRSPGFLSEVDPEGGNPPPDGYSWLRAMTSNPTLQTDEVVSGDIPPFVSQSGTYYPVSPTRIIDTRGYGIGPTGALWSNCWYRFKVTGGVVPSDAVAITANLTVTNESADGFVYLGSRMLGLPTSSTLNFKAGDDRANGVTVPIDGEGLVWAYYRARTARTTNLILDITGYFLGSGGATYVAFGPQRILETRPDGNFGLTGPFVAGTPRQIQVAGVKGLPSSGIVAVVGNLTAVNATAKGYVSVSPDPLTPGVEPGSSTLNFRAGDTRANNLVVPVNADGTLSAMYWSATAGASTDLVLDISGYFTSTGGAVYHTLEPARIMDSRIGVGVSGAFVSGTAKTLGVTGAGGVPSGAIAITGNLTVTQQTAGGNVAIGPAIDPDNPFSNLNFPRGDDRANGVTSPLSGSGSVQILYDGGGGGNTAHLILDVSGYYLAP